jgi:hypothetical protein
MPSRSGAVQFSQIRIKKESQVIVLTPNSTTLNSFADILPPSQGYLLSDVRLEIPNTETAIFKAKLHGPDAAPVWARAWLSTEAGTLAESASQQLRAGGDVTLEVKLRNSESPQSAYMRIESAPLKTEHVVVLKLS